MAGRVLLLLIAAALLAIAAVSSHGRIVYGPGVTDTEIRIGQTMPYSGANTASGSVGKAHAAYFDMINERGGLNGRKVELLLADIPNPTALHTPPPAKDISEHTAKSIYPSTIFATQNLQDESSSSRRHRPRRKHDA